ncbi:MAG: DUF1571 domain-containing protein [Pirellulaceae bacterium]
MDRTKQVFNKLFGFVIVLALLATPQTTFAQLATSAIASPAANPVAANPPNAHPLDPALQIARQSLQHIQANVDDYEALFVKRCRVDGVLSDMTYAKVKIRNRKVQDGSLVTPMAAYINFLKPTDVQGREVLWVEGKNNGNLIAHETGLKGMINVSLDPNGYLAMRGQRHPITDIGMEHLAVELIKTVQRDRNHQECQVQFYENAKIGDSVCTMLEVTHPVKRPHFDFYRARMYFDNTLKMPVRYESWSWPTTPGGEPVLEEEYTYVRVAVNVGLSERDFDVSNTEYQFR